MRVALLFCVISTAYGHRSLPVPKFNVEASNPPYYTSYFQANIDNFDITQQSGQFAVKYLINTDSFKDGGPLFFYTGNEGTIEGFAQNTGIMFDLAPNFNALIVFCEHRFYGNGSSLPFGKHSFAFLDFAKYLTIEQTLADYVTLIQQLKETYKFSKVIAFGGSYGGMLSAWFRQKYPSVVDGAWAGSAPVAYFRNSGVSMGGFDNVVTRTMQRFGCDSQTVIKAFQQLDNVDLTLLNQIFNTDPSKQLKVKEDLVYLKAYIREGFEYMAMTCYPYPSSFLRPLKAWPMLQACQNLRAPYVQDDQAARALKSAMDAFYDPTAKACFMPGCGDSATSGLGDLYGWAFQSCTQIAIDICAQGPNNDVFWPDCTKATFEKFFSDGCDDLKNTISGYDKKLINFDYIQNNYGFDLAGVSNLVLTQGYLDPWSVGGVVLDPKIALQRNIYMYTIDGAAHHLDLRVPNSCDPPTVTAARFQIVNILKCWTGQNGKNCNDSSLLHYELPTWDGPSPNLNCKDLNNQYPWGLSQETTQSVTVQSSTVTPPSTSTGSSKSTIKDSSVTGKPQPVQTTPKSSSTRPVSFLFLPFLIFFSIKF